jgi:hypothetical protein
MRVYLPHLANSKLTPYPTLVYIFHSRKQSPSHKLSQLSIQTRSEHHTQATWLASYSPSPTTGYCRAHTPSTTGLYKAGAFNHSGLSNSVAESRTQTSDPQEPYHFLSRLLTLTCGTPEPVLWVKLNKLCYSAFSPALQFKALLVRLYQYLVVAYLVRLYIDLSTEV